MVLGGIAQLARALDSYPKGRRFDPYFRHQYLHNYISWLDSTSDTREVLGSSPRLCTIGGVE